MKYEIEKEKVDDFFETVKELEDLLTERISDLHNVKGMMQARHAYIFYRRVLWDLKYSLRDSLEEVKEKPKNP
jgi:hypothetical protein